jgi:hypothetical protein
VRDINELIRQRETETVRLHNEIERIQKELEALRLTAKLLGEIPEPGRSAASSIPSVTPVYNAAPSARPAATPAATPNTWASAKQFP